MKKLLLPLCAMAILAGCSGKSKSEAAKGDGDGGEEATTVQAEDPLDGLQFPVFVMADQDENVMVHYWTDLGKPDINEVGPTAYDHFLSHWKKQDEFRRNASKYTRLFLENGTTGKVKYTKEQLVNPDGDTILPCILHYRPEIPNSGAYFSVTEKKGKMKWGDMGVIVTDEFLESHKPLEYKGYNDLGSDSRNRIANVVKMLEEKYDMKAVPSEKFWSIGDDYIYGSLQFNGEWKNAPANAGGLTCPKKCLAVDVLSDGKKLYVKENVGFYESPNNFGWNVDDDGEYFGALLTAAFEGKNGDMVICYYHPSPESVTVGIFTTKDDNLEEAFSNCYQSMVDEPIPVWRKDVAAMQAMYIAEDPGERRGTKFTKWARPIVDYSGDWLWVTDGSEDNTGAIFLRDGDTFKLIADTGANRKPSRANKDSTYYLYISGSAGGPSWYTEVYAFRDSKLVDKYTFLEVYGELESCSRNGREISVEEGKAYKDNLPEGQEIEVFYFNDVYDDPQV